MGFTDARPTGKRLGQCEACGRYVHRTDMVRSVHPVVRFAGSNMFPHSSYNSAFWTCDATDAGLVSYGVLDTMRFTIDEEAGTTTARGGTQTWTGPGTMVSKTPIDVSGWESFVFSCHVGPKHDSDSPLLYVTLGVCGEHGADKVTLCSDWTRTTKRVWTVATPAMLPSPESTYFFVDVLPETPSHSWFVDLLALQKNASMPAEFVPTYGSAFESSTDQVINRVMLTCRSCVMKKLNTDSVPEVICGQ